MRTLMVALLSLARLLSSTASKMQRVERIISNRYCLRSPSSVESALLTLLKLLKLLKLLTLQP